MLDAPTSPPSDVSPLGDERWHALIDELVAGNRTEDDFVAEVYRAESTVIDASWTTVCILDQRFRLGHVPMALYRSIGQKISQREMTRNSTLDPRDKATLAAISAPPIAHVLLLAEDLSAEEIAAATSQCDTAMRKEAVDYEQDYAVVARPLGGITINLRTYRWKPLKAAGLASTLTMPQVPRERGAGKASFMIRYADAVPLPRPIEPGRVLRDRYVLESKLGAGGMGTVYKALDRLRANLREDGRHVAVKILHQFADDDDMTRLRREFFCAQALSHPHIVKVYELDRDDDIAYFTMELLDGQLLSATIDEANHRTVPRTVAWIVIRDVAAALAYAHSRQVVHGDLKPQNIMVTESGEVHILDFGASRDPWRIRDDDETGEVTPAYATSEVLEGQMPESGDDLYALACISYELLSGAHPFKGHTATEAHELGLTPARPPMLTDLQWRAMSRVLHGERKDRTMSVDDWVSDILPAPSCSVSALNTLVVGSNSAGLTFFTGVGTDERQRATDALSIFRPTPALNWQPTKTHTPASRPNTDLEPLTSSQPNGAMAASTMEPASPTFLQDRAVSIEAASAPKLPSLDVERMPVRATFITDTDTEPNAVTCAALLSDNSTNHATTAMSLVEGLIRMSDTFRRLSRFTPSIDVNQTGVFLLRHAAALRLTLMRNSTPMIAVLVCATAWAALAKPWPWPRPAVIPAPSLFRVSTQIAPLSVTIAADLPPAAFAVQRSDANAVPSPSRLAATAAPRQLRFTANSYYLHAGQRFAELRIVRSAGWDSDARFVWWTEGGSAQPGTDYAQQLPALQVMARSQRRATLFIKIPDGANVNRKTFYVAMTDQHGHPANGVTRAMVTIPPRRGHGEATVVRGETPAVPVAKDTSLAREQ